MERLIDPRTLARVRDMPLIARTVAEGFLHGIQQSHQRGVGIEFSQFRSYEPGDDPARIDWKLFARSDRYFVREAERESEIAIWFVIDASRSMKQKSENGGWDKFDYARHLVATMSWLAQRQGDKAGLLSLSSNNTAMIPPAMGERQWHQILKKLLVLDSGEQFPDPEKLRPHLARLQQPSLVFVLSDFYQHENEILDFVRQVSSSRAEVAAMQLQCRDETGFPWRGPVRFEDLETGEEILVSSRMARETYLQNLSDHQDRLRRTLRKMDVSLGTINIDEPMDAALFEYLQLRRKRLL